MANDQIMTAWTETEIMALANGRISTSFHAPMDCYHLHWAEIDDQLHFWKLANGRKNILPRVENVTFVVKRASARALSLPALEGIEA